MAVRLYPSATAFLDSIADIQPGCLITDVRMPDMPGVPVILLVGQATPRVLDRARAAGVTRMVEKPLTGDVLLAEIKGALRPSQMAGV